ncbi:hypothetical protein E0H95_29740, partial [Pseudomonas syringae pv. tomato]|nr:hypothetical protein [Pseudomonas syringae pv. tomato]
GKRSAQAERPEALEPACRRGLKPEGARRAGFMAWLDAQHESPALSAAKGTHVRGCQIELHRGSNSQATPLLLRLSRSE